MHAVVREHVGGVAKHGLLQGMALTWGKTKKQTVWASSSWEKKENENSCGMPSCEKGMKVNMGDLT